MKQHEVIDEFQRRILLEAIHIVEQNDYCGLLISKARAVISSLGGSFNNETPLEIFHELCIAIEDMVNYRRLNSQLIWRNEMHCRYLRYDKYFKSRIRSAKIAQLKLKNIIGLPS